MELKNKLKDWVSKVVNATGNADSVAGTQAWYPTAMTALTSGFKIWSNEPIDPRCMVHTYDDLLKWSPFMQGYPYVGMSVLVMFKARKGSDNETFDPSNLLLKRYTLVSYTALPHPRSDFESQEEADAARIYIAPAPLGPMATSTATGALDMSAGAEVYYFEPSDWIAEKSESDGFADGILVLPEDDRHFTFQKQINLDNSITYFQVDTTDGTRTEILKANEQGTWGAWAVTVYNPVTGETSQYTPTDYCNEHGMQNPGVEDLRAAAFELMLQVAAPKFDLEANDDSPKTTLLTINRQATDENGAQVTIQERVLVKGTIDVQNKVFQRIANGTYVDHNGAVAENDDTKYIRVAEGIKDGKDIISPVYEIARVGGKPINVGISLEWAEWEEDGAAAVQSRNAEVTGSQANSYIDNQSGDARNAGNGTEQDQEPNHKYMKL